VLVDGLPIFFFKVMARLELAEKRCGFLRGREEGEEKAGKQTKEKGEGEGEGGEDKKGKGKGK